MPSKIDFSAEFGGQDAADVVLPHFKALKRSAKDIELSGFPLNELAFILRVDGEVSSYSPSGLGNTDFDRNGEYVSLDIVITRDDRRRLGPNADSNMIATALSASVEMLSGIEDKRLAETDYTALKEALQVLRDRYLGDVPESQNGTT